MADETEIKEPAETSLAIRESYEVRKLAREATKDSTSLFFNVTLFEHAQRVALMLSKSTMVPEQFHNIGNVMIALNYSERLGIDPFMLMQGMYVVHGRPGIEGKILIAMINRSGLFDGPIEWEFTGQKGADDWACTAYATHSKTGRKLEMRIDWKTVKAEGWTGKTGSKWQTMPEQMFRYRTASWFANTFCPEVKLGLQTVEELQDVAAVEMNRQDDGTYTSIKTATEAKLAEMKQRLTDRDLKEINDAYKDDPAPPAKAPFTPATQPVAEGNHPLARDKWIRLKGPGFRTLIEDNEDCIADLSLNQFAEIARKWDALYDEQFPWRLDGTRKPVATVLDGIKKQTAPTPQEPQEQTPAVEATTDPGPTHQELEARLIRHDIMNGYEDQWRTALERLGMGPELPTELDALIAVQEACVQIMREKTGEQF